MVNVSDASLEIFVLVIVILCYIIAPFIIYYFIKFHALSHSIMVRKRHPKILRATGVLIISWFLVGMPLMTTAWSELDRFKGPTQEVLHRLNCVFYPWMTVGIFVTTAWRFWHMFFDLKHSSSQKNSEWKYHLDPNLVEHNFWLTHKKDYGTAAYTWKIVFVWYILSALFMIGIYQSVVMTKYSSLVGHGTGVIVTNIPMNIVFLIRWKIPLYSDHFFIREEVTKVFIFMLFCIAFTFVAIGYGIFSGNNILLMMIASICGSLLFFVTALVSFFIIPRKIRREELKQRLSKFAIDNDKDKNQKNIHIGKIVRRLSAGNIKGGSIAITMIKPTTQSALSTLSITHQNSKRNTKVKKQQIKLTVVLSAPQTFKLFMQHLAKEFSMESLLCFSEIIQYKFLMLQRFNIINPQAITKKHDFTDECPMLDVVPLSLINKEGFEQNLSKYKLNDDELDLMTECKNVCLKLYEKYITSGSPLEVNIAYDDRTILANLMSGSKEFWINFNINQNELFGLYDNVATAMFSLMNGAFLRFKTKADFKYVLQVLDEHLLS